MHVFIYQFIDVRMQEKIQEKKFERMISFTRQHDKWKKITIFLSFCFVLVFSVRAFKIYDRFIDKNLTDLTYLKWFINSPFSVS